MTNQAQMEPMELVQLEHAFYRIAAAVSSADTMHGLYQSVHHSIGELVCTDNLSLALYDTPTELLSFPYGVDSVAPDVPSAAELERWWGRLTRYVVRTRQPLFAPRGRLRELEEAGEVPRSVRDPVEWLGVPLQIGDLLHGCAGCAHI